MRRNLWSQQLLQQCEKQTGQAFLQTRETLDAINQDFGRLVFGEAAAVCTPPNLPSLQKIVKFANQHQLPLTVRSSGLSQSGQSLALLGALSLDVSQLNHSLEWHGEVLIAGANVSWRAIILKALEQQMLPPVFPYNMDLSLGGVLSVGGIGSSSFKEGIVAAHIESLRVVNAQGELVHCSRMKNQDLFNACLSGTGLFGVIYDAAIKLRPCKKRIQFHALSYTDYSAWVCDQFVLREHCDYLEAFIVDEPKNTSGKSCVINLAIECNQPLPDAAFLQSLQFQDKKDVIDMPILDYIYRHDARLMGIKESGDWWRTHPWYECYVAQQSLLDNLDAFVRMLDETIGGIYHVFPIANKKPLFFMFPEADNVVTFNVLIPGLAAEDKKAAIDSLLKIDEILLNLGGKRYISGWFGDKTTEQYWLKHFGDRYSQRIKIKEKHDPHRIFCSQLFP